MLSYHHHHFISLQHTRTSTREQETTGINPKYTVYALIVVPKTVDENMTVYALIVVPKTVDENITIL